MTKELSEGYSKRRDASLKYEEKRSKDRARLPSVYVLQSQKKRLEELKEQTNLDQGVLMVTGIKVLCALHEKGIIISDMIKLTEVPQSPEEQDELVSNKINQIVGEIAAEFKHKMESFKY
jgi:hypothetical protein